MDRAAFLFPMKLFLFGLVHQPGRRNNECPEGIAQRHQHYYQHSLAAEDTGIAEVENIGDGVLESAENEGGDADKDAQHRSPGLVDLDTDKDKDAAEDAIHQQGKGRFGQAGLTQGQHCPGRSAGQARYQAAHGITRQRKQRLPAFLPTLAQPVANFSGIQIEPKQGDGDEPHSEEHRPHYTVFAAQVHIAADRDHQTSQHAAHRAG